MRDKPTNFLLSLIGQERRNKKWQPHYPPMPTKKYYTAAICSVHSLLLHGGNGGQGQLLATLKSWSLTLGSGTPQAPYYPVSLKGTISSFQPQTIDSKLSGSDLLQDNLLHIYKDEQSQPRPSAYTMLQVAWNEYACISVPIWIWTC